MARRRIYLPSPIPGMESEAPAHIPLDRTRIIQAALQQLNLSGLKELSMRKIADELDVKTASLYYHVKDKEQLLQLLADKISEGMVWPDPLLPSDEQLLQWGEQFRKVLHSYRDAADVFNATLAAGYQRLRQIEKLYGLFVSGGYSDAQIPWMASMLKSYVTGFVAEEVRLTGFAGQGEDALLKLEERYDAFHRSLPADQFPHMVRLAPYTTGIDWDREFRFGLEVLIGGFSLQLPQSAPAEEPRR